MRIEWVSECFHWRQKKILELLTIRKVLKITELTEELNVSVDTLRRDLNTLTKQGRIEKIYGGVKLVESRFGESSMDERMVNQLEEGPDRPQMRRIRT